MKNKRKKEDIYKEDQFGQLLYVARRAIYHWLGEQYVTLYGSKTKVKWDSASAMYLILKA